jgi:hypothetical protein
VSKSDCTSIMIVVNLLECLFLLVTSLRLLLEFFLQLLSLLGQFILNPCVDNLLNCKIKFIDLILNLIKLIFQLLFTLNYLDLQLGNLFDLVCGGVVDIVRQLFNFWLKLRQPFKLDFRSLKTILFDQIGHLIQLLLELEMLAQLSFKFKNLIFITV